MVHKTAISVNPRQTVEEAFVHILAMDLASVKKWEAAAIAGKDIEGVHKMRVGLRRMRSALALFRSAVPRKISRPLSRKMRWAARSLDRARDLDVYINENFPKKPGKHQKMMLSIAKRHREAAYNHVRDIIQGERYLLFNREFINWLETKAWRKQLPQEQKKILRRKVTPYACRVLDEHLTKLLMLGREIEKMDDKALHKLRIECKKLRYATEFFAPLYGDRMDAFNKQLKALQDQLGTLHDIAVLSVLHRDLLKRVHKPKIRQVADKLEARRWKEAKETKKNLLKRWAAFSVANRPWSRTSTR